MNPWFSMWIQPRTTIAYILENRSKASLLFLCAVIGWPAALQIAQMFSLSSVFSFPWLLVVSVLAAPILGGIGMGVMGFALYIIGKGLGGASSFFDVFCAVTWSNITSFVSVVGYGVILLFFGMSWFSAAWTQEAITSGMAYLFFVLLSIQAVFVIWTIYLLVQSIAQIQGFSSWKSLGNVVLSMVLLWGVLRVLG